MFKTRQHRLLRITGFLPAAILLLSIMIESYAQEPQFFQLYLKDGYVDINSRVDHQERTSSQNGDVSYENTWIDLRPRVHLDFSGSVYHPKLIDYDFFVELGQSIERVER